MVVLYIAIGGVLGTLLRYALGGWVHRWSGGEFPWGTLAVNIIGSLILGYTMRLAQNDLVSPEMRGFIAVGFCGALTTFSTYSYEIYALSENGYLTRGIIYMFGSLAAGLLSVLAGIALANAVH